MTVRRSTLVAALAAATLAGCGTTITIPPMPSISKPGDTAGQTGTAPQGQMPQGQMPQGQMPQMPQGQMPQGQMPQMPQMQMPQVQQAGQPVELPLPKAIILGNVMTASLTGAAEVPLSSSTGTGSASIKLDGDTLSWTVTYTGLTGPVTGAHLHGAAREGVNAPVQVPFAGSLGSPIVGSAKLTIRQIAELRAGLWYVNIHTNANPAGEIRGQVKQGT